MLVALTIAGSDSIGGAGIEADIKALASQGVHGAAAITAVTAQSTRGVEGIFPLRPEEVTAQIMAVVRDVHVSAAKTGMLYSAEIAIAAAEALEGKNIPLVVDPVMVAGTGDPLFKEDLLRVLKEKVLPLAAIVTPNVPEAEALVGYRIEGDKDVRKACRDIGSFGVEAVLLKGGHMDGKSCVDSFYYNGKFLLMESPRVKGRGHGGGCILSSYLTANLAKGMGLWEASLTAKASINDSISTQYAIGKGMPIVEPLGNTLRNAQRYQVATRLRKASMEMADLLSPSWVPEVGTNMVFALPGAEGLEDICALESRMVKDGGSVTHPGCVAFGASHRLAAVVMAAMKYDGGMRSAINLLYSDENLRAIRKEGLSMGSFERDEEPKQSSRTIDWGTEDAIRTLGFVPDVVFDRGGHGQEPMVRLLASSPEELVSKMRPLLE